VSSGEIKLIFIIDQLFHYLNTQCLISYFDTLRCDTMRYVYNFQYAFALFDIASDLQNEMSFTTSNNFYHMW
jgi:hypothetical protein